MSGGGDVESQEVCVDNVRGEAGRDMRVHISPPPFFVHSFPAPPWFLPALMPLSCRASFPAAHLRRSALVCVSGWASRENTNACTGRRLNYWVVWHADTRWRAKNPRRVCDVGRECEMAWCVRCPPSKELRLSPISLPEGAARASRAVRDSIPSRRLLSFLHFLLAAPDDCAPVVMLVLELLPLGPISEIRGRLGRSGICGMRDRTRGEREGEGEGAGWGSRSGRVVRWNSMAPGCGRVVSLLVADVETAGADANGLTARPRMEGMTLQEARYHFRADT